MFVDINGVWINSYDLFTKTTIDNGSTFTNLSGDTNAPFPAFDDDGTFFNGKEVISESGQFGGTIKYKSGANAWTSVSTLSTLISGTQTALCEFPAQAGLLVGNQNKVYLINTSWAIAITLTIPTSYYVTSIDVNGNVAYIGTRHISRGEAKLFTWDGTTTSASNLYGCDTYEIYSVKKYGNSVACMLSDGRLVRFNGGGFEELAVLPIYNKKDLMWGDGGTNFSLNVCNKGMCVKGDNILIKLSSKINLSKHRYINDMVGGVWCYDPNIGLYSRYSPSFTKVLTETIATSSVDTSTNIITVSSAPVTGTPVTYDNEGGATVLSPLVSADLYYVIKLSATTIKLATSYSNAIAGTAIDLTVTGNNSQKLEYYLVKDYGISFADESKVRSSIIDASGIVNFVFGDNIIFTTSILNNALQPKHALNIIKPFLPNIGYFVTPKMFSENVKDIFQKLYLKFRPLKVDDSIIIKYRSTYKDMPNYVDRAGGLYGTWTDTDTFTTTRDMSAVSVGDEIEIIAGTGAGITAHIASISLNAGTYTVNLDETFPFAVASDQFYFIADNWTKLKTITSSYENNLDGFAEITLGDKKTTWIQFKVELRGHDVTIEELQLINETFKK
jgi:hypothetical protein